MRKSILNFLVPATLFLFSGCGGDGGFQDDELGQWHEKLSGRTWRHYRTAYGGGFEHVELSFCPDGRAFFQDFYTGTAYNCEWTLSRNSENTPLITLINPDYGNLYYAITLEEGLTYFKGAHYVPKDEPLNCE
jgi:hypothetical protein